MASESTELDDLKAARANYAAILKRLTQDAAANPSAKPTYSIDGKDVSWETYQIMIFEKWEKLNQMIQQTANRGGFEVRSRTLPF